MNLILLCLTSILLGRYFEKRMHVATVAHAVMFIVLSFLFLFHSGFAIIDQAAINMFGQENFDIVHEALVETSTIYQSTISALLVMEIVVYSISAFVAAVLVIKGIKKLFKKFNFGFKVDLETLNYDYNVPSIEQDVNSRNRYLILKHLRN